MLALDSFNDHWQRMLSSSGLNQHSLQKDLFPQIAHAQDPEMEGIGNCNQVLYSCKIAKTSAYVAANGYEGKRYECYFSIVKWQASVAY